MGWWWSPRPPRRESLDELVGAVVGGPNGRERVAPVGSRVVADEGTANHSVPTRQPALDGVRALAVLAVVAFHSEVDLVGGGFLGVDVFFVLSGFLITRLLLAERRHHGRVDLGAFWSRRVRRILPALIVLIAGIAVLGAVVGLPAGSAERLPGDAVAALASVANWHLLADDGGYFALTETPSLLEHTWSLSIEEQFYLLWAPIVAASAAWLVASGGADDVRRRRRAVAGILCGVVVSAAWMWWRAQDPATEDAAYWDTLARLQGPLLGAALAVVLAGPWRARVLDRSPRVVPLTAAVGGLAVLVLLVVGVDATTPGLYPWAFLAAGLAAAVLVAGLDLHAAGPVHHALAWRPIAALGLVSYGVYLWHWPLLFLVTGARTGLEGPPLHALRLVLTVAAAVASFVLVERPARRWQVGTGGAVLAAAGAGALAVVAVVVLVPPTDDADVRAELVLPDDADFAAPNGAGGGGAAADLRAPSTVPGMPTSVPPPATTPPASGPSAPPPSTGVVAPPVPTTPAPVAPDPPPPPPEPTTVPPSTTTVPPGPPVRAVVLGDSVAESLAEALGPHGAAHAVDVIDASLFGCGIPTTGPYRLAGQEHEESEICIAWESAWAGELDAAQPDVAIVVLGRHEVFDRHYGDRWTTIGDPDYDAHLLDGLNRAVDLARQRGIPVLVCTSPFYAGREAPGGGIRPENHPARVHRFNELVDAVVAANPDVAHLLDLGALVSPGGRYAGTVDGVLLRDDGVHFAPGSGEWLAPRLLPTVHGLVRGQP